MPKTYDLSGPVAKTLEVVGERWTLLILQDLLRGYHRFAELRDSVQGIAPNVLSHRLKVLEANGIVERRFYTDHPPRAEYYLTRKGHELGLVVGALAAWGARYLTDATVLVHTTCGSPMSVAYRCPTCDALVQGAEVRLVDRDDSSPGRVLQPKDG